MRKSPKLPFSEDFEKTALDQPKPDAPAEQLFGLAPIYWFGGRVKWDVRQKDGSKVLGRILDNPLFQRTITFFGDAQSNMAHSYALAGVTAGMHVRMASPVDYAPRADVVEAADRRAAETGGSITLYTDPVEAAAGADVIVTDTWVSMGKEEEKIARIRDLGGYKVTPEIMSIADSEAIFIHCLPADRGYEVDSEVIDGPQSVVWDEAENRLHAQKALLVWLLEKNEKAA